MLGMPVKGEVKKNDNTIKYEKKEDKTEEKVYKFLHSYILSFRIKNARI
jgi:hypothetical protein